MQAKVQVFSINHWQPLCRNAFRVVLCSARLCSYMPLLYAYCVGAVFLGLDNFYYTARMLGLSTNKRISIDQLEKAAAEFCHQNWHSIRNKYFKRKKEPYALKVLNCFHNWFMQCSPGVYLGVCDLFECICRQQAMS